MVAPEVGATARGSSTPRYSLRFVAGLSEQEDGEIQSGWFPDSGVTLNPRTPWKSLTVHGARIDLVNFTHGRWTHGTCATFSSSASINITNWDVATTIPVVSFAGQWYGTLVVSQSSWRVPASVT